MVPHRENVPYSMAADLDGEELPLATNKPPERPDMTVPDFRTQLKTLHRPPQSSCPSENNKHVGTG